jgi:hypothetical protein
MWIIWSRNWLLTNTTNTTTTNTTMITISIHNYNSHSDTEKYGSSGWWIYTMQSVANLPYTVDHHSIYIMINHCLMVYLPYRLLHFLSWWMIVAALQSNIIIIILDQRILLHRCPRHRCLLWFLSTIDTTRSKKQGVKEEEVDLILIQQFSRLTMEFKVKP